MYQISFFLKGGGIVIVKGEYTLNEIRKKLGNKHAGYVEFIGNTDDGRTVSCNFDPQEIVGFTHERPSTGHVLRAASTRKLI